MVRGVGLAPSMTDDPLCYPYHALSLSLSLIGLEGREMGYLLMASCTEAVSSIFQFDFG
jgi:hypothetical protein